MPEMRFRVRWPDGSESLCYSPSLVIEEHLSEGGRYSLAEFRRRAATALGVASDRVRQKYGMPCARALRQIEQIHQHAASFAADEAGAVTILEFER